MASVTYGKRIMASVIMANVFMANVIEPIQGYIIRLYTLDALQCTGNVVS